MRRVPRLDVGDVVDARIRVGLDAELDRPERVDDVERGDVERDVGVRGQHELVRLDAAERRVAIQELPLLGDHLHLEGVLVVRRGRRSGSGPWPPPEPSLSSSNVPKPARKSTIVVVITIQSELDLGVVPERRPVEDRLVAPRVELHEPVAEEDGEQAEDRRDEARHHLVVEDLSLSLHARVARRDERADVDGDERRRDRAQHEPGDDDAQAVVRGVDGRAGAAFGSAAIRPSR